LGGRSGGPDTGTQCNAHRPTLADLNRRLGPGTLFNEADPAGEYTFLLAKHHDRT
jgi:hypothetical protein